jgi:hypothetical protein
MLNFLSLKVWGLKKVGCGGGWFEVYISKSTELFYKYFLILPNVYRKNKSNAKSNIYKIIWSPYLTLN